MPNASRGRGRKPERRNSVAVEGCSGAIEEGPTGGGPARYAATAERTV